MKKTILLIPMLACLWAYGQTPANDPHWQIVWQDHFDFFDNSKWVKANYAIHPPEPQIYLSSNVYTSNNGNLVIRVNNNPIICPPNPVKTTRACDLAIPGQTYPYNSGWVETSDSFQTQYGYIEARIKLPYRYGFWPAFWTWEGGEATITNSAEIDIFEMLGHDPANIIGTNIHTYYGDENIFGQILIPTGYSYANTWHTYGIEWSPSKIIWYIDGSIARVFPNPGIIDPVRTILNLAIEPGYLPPTSPTFTDYMYIDYVKVYDLRNDCNTNISFCNYNFGLYDNKVRKNITIGNGTCTNIINYGQNVYLRASEGVLINGDFTVPLGCELYIDVNPCY